MLPEVWPFVLLGAASLAAAGLALYAFFTAHDAEWDEERDATHGLRLIHGQGAEVRPLHRRGA